jgi:hypothetical protein
MHIFSYDTNRLANITEHLAPLDGTGFDKEEHAQDLYVSFKPMLKAKPIDKTTEIKVNTTNNSSDQLNDTEDESHHLKRVPSNLPACITLSEHL